MKTKVVFLIVMIAVTMFSCDFGFGPDEEITPEVSDTLHLVTKIRFTKGASGYASIYNINYTSGNKVASIDYIAYDGSDGDKATPAVNTTVRWEGLNLVLTTGSFTKTLYFTPDSSLSKVVYASPGSNMSKTFAYNGKSVTSITSDNGFGVLVDNVTYSDNRVSNVGTLSVTCNNAINPFAGLKDNLEVMAMLYDVELHEVYYIASNEIVTTAWGNYMNFNHSYEYDAKGHLIKVNRVDYADPGINRNSNLELSWKEVVVH